MFQSDASTETETGPTFALAVRVNVYIDVEKQWFPIGKLSTMLCLPHPCWFTGTFNATFGARESMLMREGSGKRSVSSSQKTEHRDSGLSALICNYTVHAPIPVGVIAQHSHVSGWKITILNVSLQQIWEPKASCQVVPPRLVYKPIYSNYVYTYNASKHLITTKNIQKPDSQSSCVHQPTAIPNWGTCRSVETLKSSHPDFSMAGRSREPPSRASICLSPVARSFPASNREATWAIKQYGTMATQATECLGSHQAVSVPPSNLKTRYAFLGGIL